MPIKKGMVSPRYDKEFKEGAVKLVTEQGRPIKAVAIELGIAVDTLRSWLKASGIEPSAANRTNRDNKRIRELEAQIRELKKQATEKDEVITVLKKSVGILSTP